MSIALKKKLQKCMTYVFLKYHSYVCEFYMLKW